MSIVDNKEKLHQIVGQDNADIEFSIKIGKEDDEKLDDMAVVSAKYTINGQEIGQLGVIGPQRMDYKRVLTVLREVGKLFQDIEDNKE